MRIMGFGLEWAKLQYSHFTTYRMPRKDKDWQEGETVQIVVKPRAKHGVRKPLGNAVIISKAPVFMHDLNIQEAITDGFASLDLMKQWFVKAHGEALKKTPLNKLKLRWEGNGCVQ